MKSSRSSSQLEILTTSQQKSGQECSCKQFSIKTWWRKNKWNSNWHRSHCCPFRLCCCYFFGRLSSSLGPPKRRQYLGRKWWNHSNCNRRRSSKATTPMGTTWPPVGTWISCEPAGGIFPMEINTKIRNEKHVRIGHHYTGHGRSSLQFSLLRFLLLSLWCLSSIGYYIHNETNHTRYPKTVSAVLDMDHCDSYDRMI